jgi:hypothetical protein
VNIEQSTRYPISTQVAGKGSLAPFGAGSAGGATRAMQRMRQARRGVALSSWILALTVGCTDAGTAPADARADIPPGADTTEPFPIDRGDDGPHTPGSYKGLPLRLAENSEPVVTPVGGIIGVVCIGMSNSSLECATFIELLAGEWRNQVNASVRVVNCAVGGHAIERWNDPADDARLWDACLNTRLPAAGVRPDQVRVLYHKAANQYTAGSGNRVLPTYPAPDSDYANFLANLTTFAARVPQKFPAVQAVYTTSRSYGGYAPHAGRGEPLSYEEGHALNAWLRAHRTVGSIWYGWGPYIWAPDCARGSNRTGMCYQRSDYVEDGMHPSDSGRRKIARAIHERLLQHAWYRR